MCVCVFPNILCAVKQFDKRLNSTVVDFVSKRILKLSIGLFREQMKSMVLGTGENFLGIGIYFPRAHFVEPCFSCAKLLLEHRLLQWFSLLSHFKAMVKAMVKAMTTTMMTRIIRQPSRNNFRASVSYVPSKQCVTSSCLSFDVFLLRTHELRHLVLLDDSSMHA